MDSNGGAGKLVIVGSVVIATLALIGGIYSVGQNAAEGKAQVQTLQAQMHTALRNGQQTLERVQSELQAALDRNCRILVQLDQDIRLHASGANPDDFPPFPEVSC